MRDTIKHSIVNGEKLFSAKRIWGQETANPMIYLEDGGETLNEKHFAT